MLFKGDRVEWNSLPPIVEPYPKISHALYGLSTAKKMDQLLAKQPTLTIYKATHKGKGQQFVAQGFHPADFPYHPPHADGKCYFAASNSRSLAEDYHQYYKDGILEVTIDVETYDRHFKSLERPYQGSELVELPIPHDLLSILNQFPRVLKPR